jgi:hypothetical protein
MIAIGYTLTDATDCTLTGIFGYDVIVVDRGGTCEPIRFLRPRRLNQVSVAVTLTCRDHHGFNVDIININKNEARAGWKTPPRKRKLLNHRRNCAR